MIYNLYYYVFYFEGQQICSDEEFLYFKEFLITSQREDKTQENLDLNIEEQCYICQSKGLILLYM